MSIATIEAKIKTTVANLLGTAKADAAKVDAIAAGIVADIRRVITRTALIAFGSGFALGFIARSLFA